jgi:hypothetical protein
MCEPTTIAMLVIAAAGALTANKANNDAIESSAEANNSNVAEGYRVAQQSERKAQAQAFEQQTDRMRETSRQLSLARVVSAEGGGSLAANAINIAAAGDEDFSRIDTSLTNQRGTVRDQMAALQTGNLDALKTAEVAGKNSQIKFFTDVGGAAANAYVGASNRASQKKLAQNYSDSYKLKKD